MTLVPRRSPLAKIMLLALGAAAAPLQAQGLDDAMLTPARTLAVGVTYDDERWSEYWEGTLKRDNESIGTLVTRRVTVMAGYGLTDRISLHAMLPYLRTESSAGPLHGMEGVQDLTLAAKYRLFTAHLPDRSTIDALLVGAAGMPVGDYTPDFLPMSIGLGSRRVSARGTMSFRTEGGWFVSGSGAYTWRADVKLDRPAYYTGGELFLTNEVDMPSVADYTLATGYRKGRFLLPLSLTSQRTLGGADIRRQDMPFMSNRMNFTQVGAAADYSVPWRGLGIRVAAARVVSGRNVGQSTTLSGGLHYTLPF